MERMNRLRKMRWVRRTMGICRGTFVVVLAFALVSDGSLCAQNYCKPKVATITIEGTVRNPESELVADASVFLEQKGAAKLVKTTTRSDGTFNFSVNYAGTYTVRAEKSGLRSAPMPALTLKGGETRRVDLRLAPEAVTNAASAPSADTAMEFKDEPNFAVAGVTDWSNAGLHGSDVRARTSEAIAKDALELKSGGGEKAPSGSVSHAYDAALAYCAKGDYVQARDEVRKTLTTSDSAEGHRLLGDIDEHLGDPLGSVHEYEVATRMDPSEEDYFGWGMELLLHKAPQPAAEVFTKGSQAHPDSARLLAGLGAALYASGSYDDAALRICAASDLKPSDPAPYLLLGKMEKAASSPLPCAEEKLARFNQQQPESALANYYYAMTLWKRERGSAKSPGLPKAEALAEKAVKLDPKLAEAWVQLGILYAARGAFDPAVATYQTAIEVNPGLAEAHYRLSLAYKRMGQEAKAHDEFQAYERAEKTETAAEERQRQQLRQFLIILKDQPAPVSPR
jgi:tetratricopeptide (TPR) repeat protein